MAVTLLPALFLASLASRAAGVVVTGTAGNDTLIGFRSADSIFGLDGSDFISGMNGMDLLSGGDQNDKILGVGNNDKIKGGRGDDILEGNRANDMVWGGPGNDYITGSHSNDVLYGGPGNDQILGGIGTDVIFGGNGDDKMSGGGGWDSINDVSPSQVAGNDGNDILWAEQPGLAGSGAGFEKLNPGTGADVIILISKLQDTRDVVTFKASNILIDFNRVRAPDMIKNFQKANDQIIIQLDNSLTKAQFGTNTTDHSYLTLTVSGVTRNVFQVVDNDISTYIDLNLINITRSF